MTGSVRCDVAVVGAGVTGCSIAYRLALAGRDVLVIDRGDVANGASGSCDGYIVMQTKHPGPHLDLALQSREMLENLSDELDCDVEYRRKGGLIVISRPSQWAVMESLVRQQRAAGLNLELLDRRAVREREPLLSGELDGATFCDLDGRADPLSVTHGFARGAARRGARFLLYTQVLSVCADRGRVTGLATDRGPISCDTVVLACGAWTSSLTRGFGVNVPIKPRRGIVLVTEALPVVLNHVVLDARYIAVKLGVDSGREECEAVVKYGVGLGLEQTEAGNVLIGATREFVEYDRSTPPEVVNTMRDYTIRVAPASESWSIIRTFAGLRPYTPDGLPLLGPIDGVDGLVLAAGHEGDGIVLAPITGRLIADYLCSGSIPPAMEACLPRRFAKTSVGGSADEEDDR